MHCSTLGRCPWQVERPKGEGQAGANPCWWGRGPKGLSDSRTHKHASNTHAHTGPGTQLNTNMQPSMIHGTRFHNNLRRAPRARGTTPSVSPHVACSESGRTKWTITSNAARVGGPHRSTPASPPERAAPARCKGRGARGHKDGVQETAEKGKGWVGVPQARVSHPELHGMHSTQLKGACHTCLGPAIGRRA